MTVICISTLITRHENFTILYHIILAHLRPVCNYVVNCSVFVVVRGVGGGHEIRA